MNKNKVSDFIIYEDKQIILMSSTNALTFYCMKSNKPLLVINVNTINTKNPINKLIKLN